VAPYTLKRIDDMEAIYFGAYKRVRAELGISAFGIQVIDMPPNAEQYPEHDHGSDGQEELYTALRGSGEIEINGERHPLDPETMVRVGPGVTRKVWPGEEGLRLLIVGGVPGAAYEAPPVSELGAPDPAAPSPGKP
jgi:mannose-6-phosphate isomerase-like protein (cupin superfamily)